jgi:hypothetical protein
MPGSGERLLDVWRESGRLARPHVAVHGPRVTSVQREAKAEKHANREGHPKVAW